MTPKWDPTTRFEWVALALLGLLLSLQLFVRPVAGLADNGDFLRMQLGFGIRPEGAPRYFSHVEPQYRVHLGEARASPYVSSELLPLGVAALVGAALGGLDIRLVGAAHAALFLTAAWLLLRASRGLAPLPRLAALLLFGWIFTDLEYTGYFNAMYSEASVLLFSLLVLGVTLGWQSPRASSRAFVAGVLLTGLLAALAKKQTWVFGPTVAGALLLGLLWRHRQGARVPLRFAAVGCALLVLLSARYGTHLPEGGVREANLYNTVFYGLLLRSPAPEADLAALGLPADFVRYRGLSMWHEGSRGRDPAFSARFYPQVSHRKVLAFYLQRPTRFASMVSEALQAARDMHPGSLGHFEPTAEPPARKLALGTTWSRARASLGAAFAPLAIAVLGLALLLPLLRWRLGPRPVLLLPLLALSAALQLAITVVGDGLYELSKHLFVFHILLDACFLGLCVWALAVLASRRVRPGTPLQA